MKKDFLLGLGLDEKTARAILEENGHDLIREEQKRKAALDDAAVEWRAEAERLAAAHTAELAEVAAAHETALEKRQQRWQTESFLAGYAFVNNETRAAFADCIDNAVSDGVTTRQQAFDALLLDADGGLRCDVLADSGLPSLVMPGVGEVSGDGGRSIPTVL